MKKTLGVLCLIVLIFSFLCPAFAKKQKVQTNWENFGMGSWVLHEMMGEMQQKQTLIGKNDKEITIKSEMIMNGETTFTNEIKIPLEVDVPEAESQPVDTKIYDDSVEVSGKPLAVKVYETTTSYGVSKGYMSDKVPGGIVQSVTDGNIAMKLLDYEVK